MCLCLWMIAHMFGAEGSALLSARASLVCLLVHRSSACSCIARLPFVCRYSARDMGARASDHPSARASLVRLLVHRSCIARASLALPFVCRCSARVMGARPSDHPSDRPLLVRLIVRRSSVTDLSARPYLLVHRLCIARMPVPLPLVCLLVADPSLVCR